MKKLILIILFIVPFITNGQNTKQGYIISDYNVIHKLHHTSTDHVEKWIGFTGDNDIYIFFYDTETKLFAWEQRMYILTYFRQYEFNGDKHIKMIIEDYNTVMDLDYNITKKYLTVETVHQDIIYKTIYYNKKGLTIDDIDLSQYEFLD